MRPQVPVEARRVLDPLELKLQGVVSHLMWVLGTQLQSSAKAASAFDSRTLSSASVSLLSIFIV